MFEILKNALSVAIGVLIGNILYDGYNTIRFELSVRESDEVSEERQREWEDSWAKEWRRREEDEEDDDE